MKNVFRICGRFIRCCTGHLYHANACRLLVRPMVLSVSAIGVSLPAFSIIAQMPAATRVAVATDSHDQPTGVRDQARPGGWNFTGSLGSYHTTRRDETASPFRFGGRGILGIGGIEYRSSHYRFQTEAQGTSLHLASGATQTAVQLVTASLGASMLRRFRTMRATQIDAGIETRFSADITEHSFAVSSVAPTKYRFATFTLAPDVRASTVLSWGTLRARVTSPLLGWVDHPYSAVKSANDGYGACFATVRQLRRIDADIRYVSPARFGMRTVLGLRAGAINYDDAQPVRAVTNSISAGVMLGRGGLSW